MTMIIINPGTEAIPQTTFENAYESAKALMHDCGFSREDGYKISRDAKRDSNGWYGFIVTKDGKHPLDVDIPGCDPERTQKGEPWVSPRLYVDGSSWLWGYALGFVTDHFEEYQNQER